MRLDHAIWATRDLDAAAARFEREHGLAAAGGGRHEGMGTHNRIVPRGGGYLELLAIADPGEAAGSLLGPRVEAAAEGWMGWAVLVDDVDAAAARLGTEITVIARAGFSARLTGVAEALAEPTLPFFLERAAGPPGPGGGGAAGGAEGAGAGAAPTLPFCLERAPGTPDPGEGGAAGGLARVEVAGDAGRLREWLGGA